MPNILCLSVKQPWVELLVAGKKTIELRTWWPRLQLPQLVAIHAGKTIAKDAPRSVWAEAYRLPPVDALKDPRKGGMVHQRIGGIIGVARFIQRHDFGKEALDLGALMYSHKRFNELADAHRCPLEWWHDDMTGFEFDNPIRFSEIIPLKGQLGFFRLSPEIEERVRAAMQAR